MKELLITRLKMIVDGLSVVIVALFLVLIFSNTKIPEHYTNILESATGGSLLMFVVFGLAYLLIADYCE